MSQNMNLQKKLNEIQRTLKAPKNQRNTFGGYNYRNTEDIVEAVKPLLGEDLTLYLTDDIVEVGGRVYVKATAGITDGTDRIETTAYAREAETKKGMDEAQITGAASSYARKYALNGLLAIDDTKDADSSKPDKDDELEKLRREYAKAKKAGDSAAMQAIQEEVNNFKNS